MFKMLKGKTATWIYGYYFVNVGYRCFYKNRQTYGQEKVPYGKKPIIFAANHQNAFLDPILITVVGPLHTYYLTRADIFQKPFLNKLFRSIYMLPIYRQRDGGDPRERNKETFNECHDLLSKNNAIIIFPEGNHTPKRNLRQLKKGLVRIGYGAEDKYNNELDVQIIPVGLNYSRYDGFQSDFFIHFGEPISLKDYNEQRAENEVRTINKIMVEVRKGMQDVMIDIKMDHYDTVNEMLYIFPKEIEELEGIEAKDLQQKFVAQKSFIRKIENFFETKPEIANAVEEKVKNIKEFVQEKGLKYWLFYKDKYNTLSILGSILLLILGLPLHLYGMINNYIPYKIPVWFVNSKIKDKTFHGSFKMAFGVLFFKLFWIFQIVLVAWLTDDYIWVLYALSLPLSAIYSWNYWKFFLKTMGKIKYNKLMKSAEGKQIKNEVTEIAELIKGL